MQVFATVSDWDFIFSCLKNSYDFYSVNVTTLPLEKLDFREINKGLSNGSFSKDNAYHVCLSGKKLVARKTIITKTGEERMSLDCALNPGDLTLRFGGIYKAAYVAGSIGCMTNDSEAKIIYADWVKAVKKNCKSARGIYIGNDCFRIFQEGKNRFTFDVSSPLEYDMWCFIIKGQQYDSAWYEKTPCDNELGYKITQK